MRAIICFGAGTQFYSAALVRAALVSDLAHVRFLKYNCRMTSFWTQKYTLLFCRLFL